VALCLAGACRVGNAGKGGAGEEIRQNGIQVGLFG
jgi:hypothetical protein